MSIQVMSQAPEFEAQAYIRGRGEPQAVSLAEHRGMWVVLFFYPRDFTFVCPTEIQRFAALEPEFERENAVLIGASTDSYECHKAWYQSDSRLRGVTFPVIADSSHQLSRTFGVLLEDGRALRGTFVIDPEGLVRHVEINDLGVGRNPDETLRTLQALRTGELCPVGWQPGQPTLILEEPVMVT